jgi:molybdopterin synthase catalytic subunit
MMQVRVLPFGVLKDRLGASASTMELPEGSTVADLLESLKSGPGTRLTPEALQGIAVAVNAEFATAAQVLSAGDEVGLLPPVSGGVDSLPGPAAVEPADIGPGTVALTHQPIQVEKLTHESRRDEDGALVVFDGVVRNHSRGRPTLHLDYEAYEEMAVKQMGELVLEARSRFDLRQVTMIHRLGRLLVGETSVLIVVASAHRAPAFESCRWLIDTLKKTVPIWKRETFVDGAVWAAGEPFPPGMALEPSEASHEE